MSEKKKRFELHQLLAAANERDKQAASLINEAKKTFDNKSNHYDGRRKQYSPDNESEDRIVDELEEIVIVDTVKSKLDYLSKFIVNSVDSIISKEETNASGTTNATITIGNHDFTLSAIGLLALEKKLVSLRDLYKKIPTLDPSKVWTYNEEERRYESKPTHRNRLKKENKAVVVVQATDKFPAQTQIIPVEKKTGVYEEIFYSSKISVRQKAEMIDRIDEILDKCAIAKAKGNKAEVKEVKIGSTLLNYINRGLK